MSKQEYRHLEQLGNKYAPSEKPLEVKIDCPEMRGKPFWIWDYDKHELRKKETWDEFKGRYDCCFWHIAGLPVKEHVMG